MGYAGFISSSTVAFTPVFVSRAQRLPIEIALRRILPLRGPFKKSHEIGDLLNRIGFLLKGSFLKGSKRDL